MTTLPTAIGFARLSLAGSLFGVGLLIGSVEPSAVGRISPNPVSASVPQAQDAGQSDTGIAPASVMPAHYTVPPLGAAGFGWG